MATIIPVLKLSKIADGDLEEYALDKVSKINDAGSVFTGLDPSPAELEGQANTYKDALVAADEGTKADTEEKNVQRGLLEAMLTKQATNVAEIADGNLVTFLSSGYEAKDTSAPPVGELDRPDMHSVEPTANEGELKCNWSSVDHKQNYTIRAYTDPADPEGSKLKEEIISPSKATLQGLPSGAQIYVDVRANGGSTGHGPWSDADWARPR